MLLKIKDIGMIGEGEVELKGLTVIAGENDAGKSTVGKLFYSLIRAFNKYSEEFENDKLEFLQNQIERLYAGIRRIVDFDEIPELRREFRPGTFYFELMETNLEEMDQLFERKISILKSTDIEEDKKNNLIAKIEEMRNVFSLDQDDIEVVKRALNKALTSEFNGQINNLSKKTIGTLQCSEGENELFDITIEQNKITELKYYDDLYLKDVTYIESPLLLQIHDILSLRSVNYLNLRKASIPIHLMDLINKLQVASIFDLEQYSLENSLEDRTNTRKLYAKLSEIIQGNVSFKKNIKDFVFAKQVDSSETMEVLSGNIATGIKSLGILQMLIGAGIMNDRNLLIIDEPEVHLHPKWQIEYAKIIVEIAKLQVPILINTHSPYILQGLKYYSQKLNCTELIKYYLAEIKEGETSSCIEDITDDLHKAFKKLSEPLQRLVWYEHDPE